MINEIPDEILSIIMNYSCQTPQDYMGFKLINRRCSSIVNQLEHLFIGTDTSFDKDIYYLSHRRVSLETFDWYLKNDVIFTLENVKCLIINNRIDLLRHGIEYPHFLELLFNRFYIHSNDNISTIDGSLNPLIIAAENNHIRIIKLLIEQKISGNPYPHLIPELFEMSIKYNHKNLLNYLICEHMKLIDKKIYDKLISILYRIDNCEDILFHIVLMGEKIESKHIQAIVVNHYNRLFKYIYHRDGWNGSNILFKMNLLSDCISSNNIDGFTFIFDHIKDIISRKEVTKLIFDNRNDNFYHGKSETIYNLVNNYLNYIDKESKLISICIMNDIDETTMIHLVECGFHFKECDMKLVLENRKFNLLGVMSSHAVALIT